MKTEQIVRKGFYHDDPDDRENLATTASTVISSDFFGHNTDTPPYGDTNYYILTLEKVIPEEPQWWTFNRGTGEWEDPYVEYVTVTKTYITLHGTTKDRDEKLRGIVASIQNAGK